MGTTRKQEREDKTMNDTAEFLEAEIRREYSDYLPRKKLSEEAIRLEKRQLESSAYSETEKLVIRFKLWQEYSHLTIMADRLQTLVVCRELAVRLRDIETKINSLHKMKEVAKTPRKSKSDRAKMEEIRGQVMSLREEWEPYINAIRDAIDFTDRHLEDNR